MATILEFPKHRTTAETLRSAGGLMAGADIVIFPGVRYEYWDRDPDAPIVDVGKHTTNKRRQ